MIFESEKHLVDAFLGTVDHSVWKVYPETGGFDLLLSRISDQFQIGIEAKLKLNLRVITQAADLAVNGRNAIHPGPDCRAVLVPNEKGRNDYTALLRALQIVVLRVGGRVGAPWVSMGLPSGPETRSEWPEHFPLTRLPLPDYIPDVAAGVRGPTKLTMWKVKAIKLTLVLRSRGYLVRQDFIRFDISPSTWTQRGWIVGSSIRGRWIEGTGIPDFAAQHPLNFEQIKADMPKWNVRDPEFY